MVEVVGSGEWLVEGRRRLDVGEAAWLSGLAVFDREEGWALDGYASCPDWLVARAGMGRSVAYEKCRVARELARRPVLAAAFEEGSVSYCAVRAMTRAEGTSTEVDEALVDVAVAGTVADVEATVRTYKLYQSQEKRPGAARRPSRGLKIRPLPDGMARIEIVVSEVEAAEVEAALRAITERPGADGGETGETRETGEEFSREDSTAGHEERPSWFELRADGFMELVRGGLGDWASGADRHMVHLVVREGVCRVLGGAPVGPAETARIMCDCSHVTHVESPAGEPLALGRRQRVWSVAQRRAVTVRDSGRCRWPGCDRTRVDIHHLLPWDDGGVTDVGNGVALCPQRHTCLHSGFYATGDPNGTLAFHRRSGLAIGTSTAGIAGRVPAWLP